MSKPKIVCVVPTIRPESHAAFVKAWTTLFLKHEVTLVTVWDGEDPEITSTEYQPEGKPSRHRAKSYLKSDQFDMFCRYTDACRNYGFVVATHYKPDYVLTLDDDVVPIHNDPDPIQSHLNALAKKVPLSWMNTAHNTDLYLRGVPYKIRDGAQVMLSHGVWVGTPDFDGETQLKLERPEGTTKRKVPETLPYFVGPVPRGVLFPLCGMNVMVRREALPYFYFAPMGPDSGVAGLNRFADIWMGVFLKREFDRLGWACYTGGSTVLHTRASDARKNFEQEKLGREWNERIGDNFWTDRNMIEYMDAYEHKRKRYADLIRGLTGGDK